MLTKDSVSSLHEEITVSKAKIEEHLGRFDDDMAKFTGPHFRVSSDVKRGDPENFSFEWMAHFLPLVASGIPQVKVRTNRVGPPQMRAKAYQHASNHWAREVRLRAEVEKLAVDFGMRWCVALIEMVPRPGVWDSEDPPKWPVLKRWSPRRFVYDTFALDIESRQFQGHLLTRNRDDIKAEAKEFPERGWNLEVLEGLKDQDKGVMSDMTRSISTLKADRDEVPYWEVHLPNYEMEFTAKDQETHGVDSWRDAGFNGTIFTLGVGQKASPGTAADKEWLRPPRPYFGPRSGPYVTAGGYYVPDETTPLAPLVATRSQSDHANDIARAVEDGVLTYKRPVFIASSDPNLEEVIRESDHDNVYVVNVEDLQNKIATPELGGITQQMLVAKNEAREVFERVSGLSEVMQGSMPGGDTTATAIAAATNAGARRVGYLAQKFNNDFLSHCFRNVITFMAMDEDFTIEISGEPFGEMENITVNGGIDTDAGETIEELEALDIGIEVFSSGMTDAQTQQMQAVNLDQTLGFIANMGPNCLFIDVDKYLAQRAELTNHPELVGIVDTGAQKKLAMMMLGQESEGEQGPSSPSQPRISIDSSNQQVYAPAMKNKQDIGKATEGVKVESA